MATYYVSALAAGGGDGSEGSPWTYAESLAGAAAGDTVWVKADGTYSLAATGTLANGGSAWNAYIRFRGYETTIGDDTGNRPVIQATATAITLFLASGKSYVTVENIEFDGADLAGVNGIDFVSADNQRVDNCVVRRCVTGVVPSRAWTMARTRIAGCSGDAVVPRAAGGHVESCVIEGCGGYGVDSAGGVSIVDTIFDGNNVGIDFNGDYVSGCTFYGSTSHGVQISGSANLTSGSLRHNLIVANGGDGLSLGGSGPVPGVLIEGNAFYANTSGNYDAARIDAQTTLTADPFVDALNGDFNLNDAEGGGAVLRAASFPMPGLAATAAYPFRQWVSDDFGGGSGGGRIDHFRPRHLRGGA